MAGGRDDEHAEEKLKAALWFSVGKMVDEQSRLRDGSASPQFIGAVTELVWTQIENVARDLESFSKHAGRAAVTTDDVLLLARRNSDLRSMIQGCVEEQKSSRQKGKGKAGG